MLEKDLKQIKQKLDSDVIQELIWILELELELELELSDQSSPSDYDSVYTIKAI